MMIGSTSTSADPDTTVPASNDRPAPRGAVDSREVLGTALAVAAMLIGSKLFKIGHDMILSTAPCAGDCSKWVS